MIITCDKCGITFRVDASLLSPAGSKVRCSVCLYVFNIVGTFEDFSSEVYINSDIDYPDIRSKSSAGEWPRTATGFPSVCDVKWDLRSSKNFLSNIDLFAETFPSSNFDHECHYEFYASNKILIKSLYLLKNKDTRTEIPRDNSKEKSTYFLKIILLVSLLLLFSSISCGFLT